MGASARSSRCASGSESGLMATDETVPHIEGQMEFDLGTEIMVRYPLEESDQPEWLIDDFDPEPRCVKCRKGEPTMRWHATVEAKQVGLYGGPQTPCYEAYTDTIEEFGMHPRIGFPEHFDYECRRCGYRWVTRVAPKDQEQEQDTDMDLP